MTPELLALGKGALLGFSVAAPVGPIGVLCIRRTLAEGRWIGLATGLGAAAADGLYGACAALGLTAVTNALVGAAHWVRLIGGVLLLVMAWRTWRAQRVDHEANASGAGWLGAFGSTFLLTLSNPMTILSFVAVFAGLGIGSTAGRPFAALLLVAGVLVGSAAWWLLLSGSVSLMRERVSANAMHWINRASAGVMGAFGLYALGSGLLEGVR